MCHLSPILLSENFQNDFLSQLVHLTFPDRESFSFIFTRLIQVDSYITIIFSNNNMILNLYLIFYCACIKTDTKNRNNEGISEK